MGQLQGALGGSRPGWVTHSALSPSCPLPTVTNCSAIEGAEYSPCGPPCPRSCDDLVVSLGS